MATPTEVNAPQATSTTPLPTTASTAALTAVSTAVSSATPAYFKENRIVQLQLKGLHTNKHLAAPKAQCDLGELDKVIWNVFVQATMISCTGEEDKRYVLKINHFNVFVTLSAAQFAKYIRVVSSIGNESYLSAGLFAGPFLSFLLTLLFCGHRNAQCYEHLRQ